MKQSILLFLIIVFATTAITAQSGTTFKVCEVDTADQLIKGKPYKDVILEYLVDERNKKDKNAVIQKDKTLDYRKMHKLMNDPSYYPEDIPNRILEASAVSDKELIHSGFHPFVATMHQAYAKHYPMTISPDMIWLLIAQGFAIHVNQNAEELRDKFVDFDGKKQIDVRRNLFVKGSETNDWPSVFEEFGEKIEENTGAELLDLVTSDFSTTGATEKVAFQITLMDAMKSYFEYSVTTSCGIPKITLEGTPDDWKKIEEKAQQLAQYDLKWWIKDLAPVLKEFTKASNGKVDTKFWESIYKWTNPGSGSPYITGWVLNFFPYLKQNDKYVQKQKRNIYVKGEVFNTYSATTRNFSSGISHADFVWNYHETYFQMEFVAGFVGYHQDSETLSLRPEISWAVIDKQLKASDEMIENYKKGGDKKYRDFIKKNGIKE